MGENEGVRCEAKGRFRYTWPGNDEAIACQGHADQIKTVANAMGSRLQMIPLSENDLRIGLQCHSFVVKE